MRGIGLYLQLFPSSASPSLGTFPPQGEGKGCGANLIDKLKFEQL